MPESFEAIGRETRLWVPFAFKPEQTTNDARHNNSWGMIARLKPGVTLQRAQQRIDALNRANLDLVPEMKALIDRACLVGRANGGMFRRKVGAAVIAVRRAGAIQAFDTLNHFFLITEMIVPGSSYWNIAIGRDPGDVEKDEEGIATMKTLGKNMAWLLKKTAPAVG
jgi:hypothetical protein